MEYVFSQSLSLISAQHDTNQLFVPLHEFKKLLYLDLSKIRLSPSLDPIVVINHIMVRSGTITIPSALYGWSETEYVRWLDIHLNTDVRRLIRRVLDTYLEATERMDRTETCLEHPVLRNLLLEWERNDSL